MNMGDVKNPHNIFFHLTWLLLCVWMKDLNKSKKLKYLVI